MTLHIGRNLLGAENVKKHTPAISATRGSGVVARLKACADKGKQTDQAGLHGLFHSW